MTDMIQKIYEEYGYPAAARLHSIVKSKGIKDIKLSEVKEFVASQQVAQLHKKAPKVASTPITADGKNTEYQMDLLDMSSFSRTNAGLKWILIVENIWDRRARAKGIKTKSPNDVLPALKSIIDDLGAPVQIVSDSGTEFAGAVDKYFVDQSISHRKVAVGDHHSLGIIDSFARYVKNSLSKHMTHTQSTNWNDYMPTLVKNYNDTQHSSLKLKGDPALTPNEASHLETDVRNIHVQAKLEAEGKKSISPFNVGDSVRVLKNKEIFDRGYQIRYSIQIFKIVRTDGQWYVLDSGKKYREGSLQKVQAPEVKLIDDEKEEIKDVRRIAAKEHKVENILIHKEGVSQDNRRSGLRERKPQSQVEDKRYGKIGW